MSAGSDEEEVQAGGALTALVAVYVALALVAVSWTVTRLYVLNFSTAGPNATAGLAVLLVSGWVLVPLGAADVDARELFLGGSALAVVGTVGTFVGNPLLSGVAGVVLLTASTAVLFGLLVGLRGRFAVGAAGGVLLHHAVRSWFNTAPAHASQVGQGFVLGGALVGAVACWQLSTDDGLPAVDWDSVRVSASPAVAFLLVEAVFLGAPQSVARWALRPYVPALAASVAGLVVGAWVVVWRGPPARLAVPAWGATLVLSVLVLVYWPSPYAAVAAAPAQAAAVALLAGGSRRIAARSTLRTAGGVVAVQAVGVVLLFLFVSAVNWAFVPAPLDRLTRGRAGVFLVAVPALQALTVAVAVLRPSYTGTSAGRRSVLGAILAGAAAVGGAFVPRGATADPPREPPYRVLTYNVHQFLGGSSQYNLRAALEVIRRSDAAIVGLQESEGTRITTGNVDGVRWLADELGYEACYGVPTREGGYGVALLSPWPIEKVRTVHLPVADSPTRPALIATVDAPDGELPVMVTHFQTDTPPHRQPDQAHAVVDLTAEYDRALVLGDFNTPAGDREEPYRILNDAFTDAWTAAGNAPDSGPTYSAADPRRRIDYVWLKGEWTAGGATTVGTPAASDHLGVLAEVDPEP